VYAASAAALHALDLAGRVTVMGRLAVWEPPYVVDRRRPSVPADLRPRLIPLQRGLAGAVT